MAHAQTEAEPARSVPDARHPAPAPAPDAQHAIRLEVRDLVVPGDDGRPVLSIETLDLEPGALLGVRGPSGAGKSTLVFALAGLAPGMSGRVAWDGRDLVAMSPRERAAFRRSHIGMVFQDHLLFEELDAAANAGLAALFGTDRGDGDGNARPAVAARGRERLHALGVPPERRTAVLSGGERQRVAIARALASEPGILLADEPTASLHADAGEAVTSLLAGETGRTRVVASHDERLLASMTGVLELSDGLARTA